MASQPDSDDALARQVRDALLGAVDRAVGPWVVRGVLRVGQAQLLDAAVLLPAAEAAGEEARAATARDLRELLETDVDEQRTNPLGVLRAAVRFPTAVLRDLGARPVERDPFERERFPDDPYGLTPATWSDVDPALHEPGLVWGAWKAKTVLDRRRAEGRR